MKTATSIRASESSLRHLPFSLSLAVLSLVLVSGAVMAESTTESSMAAAVSVGKSGVAELPWPQWRGPHRTGTVADDGPRWPGDLSGLEKVWQAPDLGPSYSGPIIGATRIFTTETRDKSHEVVTAYDRATGKKLWSQQWKGAMKVPFFAAKNGSWIRSTPAYDGETLFVGGIQEVLVALDAETGDVRWTFDFPDRFDVQQPPFGFVCSPLIEGDHVYLEAAGSLFKLNKANGEVIWRSERFSSGDMSSEGTFSSPVFAELAGQRQLLVQTRHELKGVDAETGKVLWSQHVPSFRGMNILTPVVWQDRILTSTYRNNSFLFKIEAASGGHFIVREAWNNEAQAYMSSPILIGDHAYLHLGNGRLTAVDLKTGERHWTSKPFGKYWSMANQGDRILALDADGELLLIDASPEAFQLLDQKQVSNAETWAHLAVADDELVIRDLGALTVWRWKQGAEASSAASPAGATAP